MQHMKIINNHLLDNLSHQAKENERLRQNYNLHAHLADPVQRLLNALEPGTTLPVHRHLHSDETFILMRGSVHVLLYDDQKCLIKSLVLSVESGNFGLSIPAGQWHTIDVLESGTVLFEIKQGPYTPLESKDILHMDAVETWNGR